MRSTKRKRVCHYLSLYIYPSPTTPLSLRSPLTRSTTFAFQTLISFPVKSNISCPTRLSPLSLHTSPTLLNPPPLQLPPPSLHKSLSPSNLTSKLSTTRPQQHQKLVLLHVHRPRIHTAPIHRPQCRTLILIPSTTLQRI